MTSELMVYELIKVKSLLNLSFRSFYHIKKKVRKYKKKKLPDKECVHLFEAELQNLFSKIPINLCSNLQVLFKHLMKTH